MAISDEINIKLKIDDGELKLADASIKKQSAALDKNTGSKKKNEQQGKRNFAVEKSLHQTTLNSTKAFSKQARDMGGSSGLVAAYATLAANVFAATAAFGALSRAAQFEQLKIGLVELGAASGQTLSVMANGLREVTGMAISAEEAMRGAALGISGGFSGVELEGLAKVAKGASITLGRNLPDAFDRLTRGAIKLEPEILDELGIMVRLDDAVEKYAAQLGKSVGSLTQMERRQAFMNEILEQGALKFGAIADEVDADVYSQLGATFSDLTKDIFTFVNDTLRLTTVIKFLSENTTILLGTMILFGSTIAGKMLPVLGQMGEKARATADNLHRLADSQKASIKAAKLSKAEGIIESGVGSDAFKDIMKSYKEGTAGAKELTEAERKIGIGLGRLRSKRKFNSEQERLEHIARIKQYETEKAELGQLIALEEGRARGAVAAESAEVLARNADTAADAIGSYSAGAAGLGATFAALKENNKGLSKALFEQNMKMSSGGAISKIYNKALAKATAFTTLLGQRVKVLGAAFLKALPLIGLVTVALGAAYLAYRKFFLTEEHEAFMKQQEETQKILENQVEIQRKFLQNQDRITQSANRQTAAYVAMSGMIKETNQALREEVRLRKLSPRDQANLGRRNAAEEAKALAEQTQIFDYTTGFTVMGDTGDVKIIKEFGDNLGSVINQISDEADKINFIERLFGIEKSAEFKFFKSAINSDIPKVAEMASKKFQDIMSSGLSGAELAAALEAGYGQLEEILGGIGAAAQGVANGLRESEKEGSKFLASFSRKTKISEFARQVEGMRKNLKTMRGEVDILFDEGGAGASADRMALEMGQALSGVGSRTADLVGPEFAQQVRDIKKEEDEMRKIKLKTFDTEQERLAAIDAQQAIIDEQVKSLGKMDGKYESMIDKVLEIERAEISNAQALKAMQESTKIINSLKKQNVNLAKEENRITQAQLALEVDLAKKQLQLLERQFTGSAALKEEFKFGKDLVILAGQRVNEGHLEIMSYEDKIRLAEQLGISADKVFSMEELHLKILENQRKKDFKQRIREDEFRIAELARLQKIQQQETAIFKLRQEQLKITMMENNFNKGDASKLTAVEESELRIAAAREELATAQAREKAEKEAALARQFIALQELEELKKKLQEAKTPMSAEVEGILAEQINRQAGLDFEKIEEDIKTFGSKVEMEVLKAFDAALQLAAEGRGMEAYAAALKAATDAASPGGEDVTAGEAVQLMETQVASAKEALLELGPQGEAYAGVLEGMNGIANSMLLIGDAGASSADKIRGVTGTLKGIGQMIMQSSKAQSAEIENQIKAEEKRDGKSKESLAKIKAMKAKQYAIEKKAFEQNKKIQLANAIINGMAAIQSGFKTEPFFPLGLAMGALATGITMMQIKAIRGQTFQGDNPNAGAAPPASISVGARDSRVDVSQRATAGELAYLRGDKGVGTTANQFQSMSGAAGLRKGYASGGVLVGEQGPEVIKPYDGFEVVPNDALGGKQVNAHFTINAIDARGVEEVLQEQQGNIIGMIRSAANDYGQEFLEAVEVDHLAGTPKSAGGIDY